MAKNREWWQRVVGFPVLLVLVLIPLSYQIKLAWERAIPLEHEAALSWQIFIDGYEAIQDGRTPTELHAYNKQEVALYGFMFPLEFTEKHHHFLLVSHSASCPFHQLLGQGNVVEVKAKHSIGYDRAPILIRGILAIDEQAGADIQYRLDDAILVTP